MAKTIIDGFEFFDWGLNQKLMYFSNSNLAKALDYIKEKQIKEITISDDFKDLLFFKEITFVEDLHIGDKFTDYTGIYFIENLKKLTINDLNSNSKIQFKNFKLLEYLSVDWNKKLPDLSENKKLKELYIWKFKPECKSFQCLSLPESLELVHITETNIENLSGLQNTKVNQLEAYYCSKLTTLNGLSAVKNTLKTLIINNAINLRDFNDLWECVNLEKIIFTNCGVIPSLKNLSKFKNLKMFTFYNTTIEDGDLSDLFEVDYVYFKNQKHYNHKYKEFENKKH